MALSDIVRSGLAIADSLTGSLQAPVKHYKYSEATLDDTGKVIWGAPYIRMGIVEHARTQQRNKEDREVANDTQITFPRPFDIDPRDRFEMPDGNGDGPANRVAGLFDPLTNKIYMTQIWIGSNRIT
jgi:hypothetical protein